MNSFGRGNDNKEKNKASVITRETVGMTLLLFGVIMFFIAVTSPYVFGDPGAAITSFFLGVFGLLFYPLDLIMVYFGVTMVIGKKPIPARWILRTLFLVLCVFFIVHIATAEKFYSGSYGAYLSGCWTAANDGAGNGTGGGVLLGIVAFPVTYLLTSAGAYVLFSLLTVLAIFLILMLTPLKGRFKILRNSRSRIYEVNTEGSREYPAPVGFEFDNLPPPSYRPVPREPEPEPAPQPAPALEPAPQPAPRSVKEQSRDVLFSNDPASNYRNNLIYDHDSQFNTQPRRSSVSLPASTEPAPQTVKPGYTTSAYSYEAPKPDYSAPSYSERYSTQAETERPAMPRKITPAERAYPTGADYDYSQTPSYRAPSVPAPAEEKTDYYSHDVPSPYTPAEEAPFSEPTEPAQPEPSPFSARNPYAPEPTEPARTAFEPEPLEPETSAEEEKSRDEIFRSIFSRPVERMRTEIKPEEPAARFAESAAPAPEESDRFTPSHETPRFGFGADLSKPEESAPEESIDRFSSRMPEENTDRFSSRMPEESTDRFSSRMSEENTDRFSSRMPEESADRFSPRMPEENADRFGSRADLFESDEPDIDDADYREEPSLPERSRVFGENGMRSGGLRDRGFRSETPAAAPVPDAPAPQMKRHIYKPYRRPSNDLLHVYDDTVTVSQDEIEHNSSIIVETLAGFRVDAEVVKVRSGSAVTRYDIDIPKNIAVRTVIKRDAEIAMRLHARDGVNIYSNSEVGAISIEVPNSVRATVGLRSVLMADEYLNAKPNSLMFAIGKDIEGRNVCGNIVKMKHILVAGSTGSGKSVCLNAMLISLICRYSPADLRLILIDPKKVEFAIFDGLPHLMINEVIADANKAISALNWAIKEMERRYCLFEQKTRGGMNVHNVDEYNASLTEDEEKLPKIVIVVDELADLMSVAKKDIEDRIQRLAQKARAAGMHLVIATQRPSVDVITGVIKGNLPTRLAFRVIQEVDSRTILDESGAEKLLGNGDMLYRTEGMFNCLRVQGAFLSSQEVQAVIEDIKTNNEAYFDESVADYINRGNQSESGGMGADGDVDDDTVDPQYIKALAIVVKLGSASISLIQRKCSVGYNHAGKIIEWMELMNYISPFDGKAKARTVLMTKEEFEGKYGSLDQW